MDEKQEQLEIDPKQLEEFMKAFAKVTVLELLIHDIDPLIQKAWTCMGIALPYGEKEPKVNMDDAKLAIDVVEFLASKIEDRLQPEEVKSLKQVIANLQINYVKKSEEK